MRLKQYGFGFLPVAWCDICVCALMWRKACTDLSFGYSFSHSVVFYDRSVSSSKAALHPLQSSASPFNFQYPLVSLKSSDSCLRLLPHLPVIPILPSILSSIMCFKRQFLPRMWPVWLALFSSLFSVCRIFPFGVYVCSDELKSAFQHPKGRDRLVSEDNDWVLNRMQGCVLDSYDTGVDAAAGFCEHTVEPPEYSCLILTVRASQSFETPKTTHATKQRHIVDDLSNVAFRSSYITSSGVNENWTFLALWTTSSFSRETVLRGLR